ncbi:hypothetical protein ZYGR_0AS00580 [Zygosaccharomyces rouxii]|uniref:Uncharacterized protein n=1 Tax=Zygosaccharomyces rouxii TaxID=4956 RepID=A0A1Q3AG42_ZYGRO|nr:hypothetical protein ZYGR_0AS00580 [Zygosaccharomyces rouxii]
MAPKKRVATEDPVPKPLKKGRKHEVFESQDIWKNLDKIRTQNTKAGSTIPNSCLFVPIFSDPGNFVPCINALHKYVDSGKLKLQLCDDCVIPGYVCLQGFSLMDCCLVISILFGYKNKRWFAPNDSQDFFTVPKGLNVSGTFYLPSSCTGYNVRNVPNLRESQFQTHYNFKEYYISSTSLSQTIQSLMTFFHDIKFGKSSRVTSTYFSKALNQIYQTLDLSMRELPFMGEGLYNPTSLTKINLPSIEKSKNNLQRYAQELIKYNSSLEPTSSPSSKNERQATATHSTTRQGTPSRTNSSVGSGSNTAAHGSRPNFMTQDQIKQHCVATVKASQEVVKAKSPYQILKTYVKCPRQGYIDKVYQNLNDLRAQTNCNIVVLNLNNLHESRPWFDSLNVSKFTTYAQQPHPSTVRVVSIGGVGEHVQKALELIYKILLQENVHV